MDEVVSAAQDVLASPARRSIIDALTELPRVPETGRENTRDRGLTAQELATRLGVHVTTIRFHLEQLTAAGLIVEHDERGRVGRPRRRYAAVGVPNHEVRASEAYQAFQQELQRTVHSTEAVDAERLGVDWAARHAQHVLGSTMHHRPAVAPAQNRCQWFGKLGALLDVLDAWGYDPELTTSNAGHQVDVLLHSCPMRELARQHPDIVCTAHRGALRGLLIELGESDDGFSLDHELESGACRASTSAGANLTAAPARDEQLDPAQEHLR